LGKKIVGQRESPPPPGGARGTLAPEAAKRGEKTKIKIKKFQWGFPGDPQWLSFRAVAAGAGAQRGKGARRFHHRCTILFSQRQRENGALFGKARGWFFFTIKKGPTRRYGKKTKKFPGSFRIDKLGATAQ